MSASASPPLSLALSFLEKKHSSLLWDMLNMHDLSLFPRSNLVTLSDDPQKRCFLAAACSFCSLLTPEHVFGA